MTLDCFDRIRKCIQRRWRIQNSDDLFVVCPKPNHFDNLLVRVNLIDKAMLDIYPTRICSLQVANESFEWGRISKRILLNNSK